MRCKPRSQQISARHTILAALLLAGLPLMAGCVASNLGDHMPTVAGGLPEGAPARPQTPQAYPAVHDLPPPRSETVLTAEEQKKVEEDLVAARNRAAAASSSPSKPAGALRNQ
jgi:hypothetical protein